MSWPGFPLRLQSALKALCCLAESGDALQSHVIAGRIGVPRAETAKILQLLVWGGFVTSRRGTKGGFHLAASAAKITMGEVIDFFLARHPVQPDRASPVMRALRQTLAPCQQRFARLTLARVADFPPAHAEKANSTGQRGQKAPKIQNSSIRKLKRRSQPNATNRK